MKLTHLLVATLFALPAAAQGLKPGTFLAATNGTSASSRGVFVVDRFAKTSTRMAIQGINWSNVGPMSTHIETANSFLLGVMSGLGFVYRVSWNGTAWQAKVLNTQGMGTWLGRITRIGSSIYVATWGAANTAILMKFPAAGGQPTVAAKLGTAVGGPITGSIGALLAVGTDIHVFMWDARNTQGGAHITVDSITSAISYHGRLPRSIAYLHCASRSFLPRQAVLDPDTGLIVLGGRLGDVLWRTTAGADIRHEIVVSPFPCNAPKTNWGNAMALNSDTGAVLVGDSDGSLEERTHDTWRQNVQAIMPGAPVNSLEYFASGSLYRKTGPGCAQSNGQVPSNYINSLPTPGNSGFRMTVTTPSKAGWLFVGLSQATIGLGPFGAPGCWLGATPGFVAGAGAPTFSGLELSLAIPQSLPPGLTIYTQWIIPDTANGLGVVTSDTRVLK